MGSPGFTLVVDGTGFVAGTVLRWNTARLATVQINATRLTAAVPATLTAAPALVQLAAVNPNNAISPPFQVSVGAPFPGITSLNPDFIQPGGGPLTLTINGQNFLPGASVLWEGVGLPLQPVRVTPTQITLTVPASLVVPGIHNVWVQNELTFGNPVVERYGASSNNVALRIGIPWPSAKPVISAFTPASGFYRGPEFSLTVSGRNFDRNAVVIWNGRAAPTTYVNSSQLVATISSEAQAFAGIADFWVNNPGTTSDNARYIVNDAPAALLAISPESVDALAGTFPLATAGYGFIPGAAIRFNGTPLATTVQSSSLLVAQVPVALLATPGTARVDVVVGGYVTGSWPLLVSGPLLYEGGAVNVASSIPVIAPGSLIAIYGARLASTTARAAGFPLPSSLNATSVTINGLVAPLLFVSPAQINAQVPYDARPGAATLAVRVNNFASSTLAFTISPVAPGIFTLPGSDRAVAVNVSDGSLNSPQSPVSIGQYVTVYVTGQGNVNLPVAAGVAAPASPLSLPVATTEANIGGQTALVQFAGLAPGFAGLLQMNIQIPDVAPGQQTLQVVIGGIRSNTVTLSVRP